MGQKYIGLFLDLVYTSVFMLGPHCIGFCGFVVSFEIGKYESFTCVVLFQGCLVLGGHLKFHINWRICFSFLQKKMVRILIEIVPIDLFGQYCHVSIVNLPIHEDGMCFHLFKSLSPVTLIQNMSMGSARIFTSFQSSCQCCMWKFSLSFDLLFSVYSTLPNLAFQYIWVF